MIISGCRSIVAGKATGFALVTAQPVNFLSMVDLATGRITDKRHELFGRALKGVVLAFPYAIGSSVGAYAIYSLKQLGNAPSAVVCSKADITTASGCAIAGIPVVDLPAGVKIDSIPSGAMASVDATDKSATVKI